MPSTYRLRRGSEPGFKIVKWIAVVEFLDNFADLGVGEGSYNGDHEFYGYCMPV